jgi:hypothetical protein
MVANYHPSLCRFENVGVYSWKSVFLEDNSIILFGYISKCTNIKIVSVIIHIYHRDKLVTGTII